MSRAPSTFDDISESIGSELAILTAPAAPARAPDSSASSGGSPALPRLMTILEVADQFGVSDRTIGRWKQEGRLAFVRVGRTVRFRAEDVLRLIDENLTMRVLCGFASRKSSAATQYHK